MIVYTTDSEAFSAKRRLIRLLKRTGLAKVTADSFVQVCITNDKQYVVGIASLLLHSHCLRYRKYQDNESLYDLVKNSAVNAKLSQEDTDFLLSGL